MTKKDKPRSQQPSNIAAGLHIDGKADQLIVEDVSVHNGAAIATGPDSKVTNSRFSHIRSNFDHKPTAKGLRAWLKEHMVEIVTALLTAVIAWITLLMYIHSK